MKQAIANLNLSLNTECPHCNHEFDLTDDDPEYHIANAIFNNEWDILKGHEVICPDCHQEFELEKVEY